MTFNVKHFLVQHHWGSGRIGWICEQAFNKILHGPTASWCKNSFELLQNHDIILKFEVVLWALCSVLWPICPLSSVLYALNSDLYVLSAPCSVLWPICPLSSVLCALYSDLYVLCPLYSVLWPICPLYSVMTLYVLWPICRDKFRERFIPYHNTSYFIIYFSLYNPL